MNYKMMKDLHFKNCMVCIPNINALKDIDGKDVYTFYDGAVCVDVVRPQDYWISWLEDGQLHMEDFAPMELNKCFRMMQKLMKNNIPFTFQMNNEPYKSFNGFDDNLKPVQPKTEIPDEVMEKISQYISETFCNSQPQRMTTNLMKNDLLYCMEIRCEQCMDDNENGIRHYFVSLDGQTTAIC